MHSSLQQKTKIRILVAVKMVLTLTLSQHLGWLLSQKTIYRRTIFLVSLNLIKNVDPILLSCLTYFSVVPWSKYSCGSSGIMNNSQEPNLKMMQIINPFLYHKKLLVLQLFPKRAKNDTMLHKILPVVF